MMAFVVIFLLHQITLPSYLRSRGRRLRSSEEEDPQPRRTSSMTTYCLVVAALGLIGHGLLYATATEELGSVIRTVLKGL